jgi:predicted PurR-regulated permease PerM
LGIADNVLKPLMLGRLMLVILLGALGGMAAAGMFGMFIGDTLLALGYQIFIGWVHTDPDAGGAIRITSRQRTKTHFARSAHMPVPSINRERGS